MCAVRVLVADDHKPVRLSLVALFEDEGFTVSSACGGSQAIALLAEDEFDLIVSDLQMPEGDGYELLTYLREHHPSLPVILMSAETSGEAELRARLLGASDFLAKPFDFDDLLASVEKLAPPRSSGTG